ncbi:hypothetical protein VNO77_10976 [Canavalia gladiata]|uniref:Uncharacterized protein n=1 Tax=Canavalia gladiata TaxID=3824 RepID=A0AAN9MBI8_CANGL
MVGLRKYSAPYSKSSVSSTTTRVEENYCRSPFQSFSFSDKLQIQFLVLIQFLNSFDMNMPTNEFYVYILVIVIRSFL